MKRIRMIGTAILATVLIPACFAQTEKDAKTQAKQEKRAQKAQAKTDKKGKKTTDSQDAAYAAAYSKGIPQGQSAPK